MKLTPEIQLWNFLRARLPRIITQLSRDPDSPTFGSWDRNFWHYKMRDFSSMILQQGMMAIDALERYQADDNPLYKHPMAKAWIDGSLDFWSKHQLKNGSFNEYYPFEAGFPPTAFSLFAVGVIMKNRGYMVTSEPVKLSIQKAVNWLLKHPEKEALNQEAAGLAGIILCSKIPGIRIDAVLLEKRLTAFYASQSEEGWFPEYDGPDTGYLAVTIDCLWEMYEVSGDRRAFQAMEKAVGYIAAMMSVSGEMPVMVNSRNTDYLVIYGMTRMAEKGHAEAGAIVNKVLERLDSPDHFLNRTDDRYAVHYVYSSYFRSLAFINKFVASEFKLPCETKYEKYFSQAGIYTGHSPAKHSFYLNLRKGGIVNVFSAKGIYEVDFGFRIRMGKSKVAVMHWQHPAYQIKASSQGLYEVSGPMTLHGWMVPGPLKHIALRAISMLFGKRIIPMLKKKMIFNLKNSGYLFTRRIEIKGNSIAIEDEISGTAVSGAKIYRAPHYSLRHVSSAGQFMAEESLVLPDDKGQMDRDRMIFVRTIELD